MNDDSPLSGDGGLSPASLAYLQTFLCGNILAGLPTDENTRPIGVSDHA